MEVLLLGTGSPEGWPSPGCRCASCSCAAPRGLTRAPTSALVDDVLLLDPTPEASRLAATAGRVLSRVRTLLLSAQQDPPQIATLIRSLARQGPVEVLGAASALGPHALLAADEPRVQLTAVSAGDVVRRLHHVLRAVPQGGGIGWDVSSSSGGRLLYAPGADVVRVTAPGGGTEHPYDIVLLGGGTASSVTRSLRVLRGDGALAQATDVVVVGVGHAQGHPDTFDERLQGWGVRAVADGTLLRVGDAASRSHLPTDGRTLVLGGARSGKSALAEQLLAAHPEVTYVATGGTRSDDPEWSERVAAHVARRPTSWRTVETTDVAQCLRTAHRPLLIDCLGTWLTSRLDCHGVWHGADLDAVHADVAELVLAWRSVSVPVVAVSNEVGSGVVPATAAGRLFRDLLGRLNATIAAECETVLLTVAGMPVPLRVRAST